MTPCHNCKRRPMKSRCRGLCHYCFQDPVIRDQYEYRVLDPEDPSEEELERIIAEQSAKLPAWWSKETPEEVREVAHTALRRP